MDFKDLNYMVAIAKFQNITKAADSLCLTQPTLTKFLQNIERDLGQKLFSRVGNKFVLTYAGDCYLRKAKEMLALKKELDQELSDIITAKVLSDTKLSKSTTPIKIQNIDNLSKLNELFAGKWSMELDMQGMTIDQKIDNIYNKMESISKPTYNEAGELFERKKVISKVHKT